MGETSTAHVDLLSCVLGPLQRRFERDDNAAAVLTRKAGSLEVVTGFGPTNAPTAGTLSVMLGVVELQQQLDWPISVVVSELGAWNSRNVAWDRLEVIRDQMFSFLRFVGFDERCGTLRSHLDRDNLTRAGRIARFLHRDDLVQHREELYQLYQDNGLLGSEVGMTVDCLYTVADILGPLENGASRVLVVCGEEEAYFMNLARLVLHRQNEAGALSLRWHGELGALYFRVLEGLAGYPKMSKSIPASGIHLEMTYHDLQERILTSDPASQSALASAIELASGWDQDRIDDGIEAFRSRHDHPARWASAKATFLATFNEFADAWKDCRP